MINKIIFKEENKEVYIHEDSSEIVLLALPSVGDIIQTINKTYRVTSINKKIIIDNDHGYDYWSDSITYVNLKRAPKEEK